MSTIEEDLRNAIEEVSKDLTYAFNNMAVTSKELVKSIHDTLEMETLYEDRKWLVRRSPLIDNENNIAVYKKVWGEENIEKEISDLPKDIQDEVIKKII